METEEFKLGEFKSLLKELHQHLEQAVNEDLSYEGEIDLLVKAIIRLQEELQEMNDEKDISPQKYEELLPDILMVVAFINEMNKASEDSEENEEEDDYNLSELEEEGEEAWGDVEQEYQQWIEAFIESSQFDKLSENQKEDSVFILESFSEFLFEEGAIDPFSWTTEDIEDVCLELFPQRVCSEPSTFQNIGPVLSIFFDFLFENNLLQQADQLAKKVRAIQQEIPKKAAANSDHWEMTKAFAMQVKKSNVIDSEDQMFLENFLNQINRL